MTATHKRQRQVRGSDKAHTVTLTCKVSTVQQQLILDVIPAGQTVGEWLRLAAISMAYHEHRRLALAAGNTQQDLDAGHVTSGN